MSFKQSNNPHEYVYVLTDEIQIAFQEEPKEFFSKKLRIVEYQDTIELINYGIRKFGDRYIGTYDQFYFDKPRPIQLLSKTSYDELVKIFRWRHENNMEMTVDYDTAMICGESITDYSSLKKKYMHIISELTTLYPGTKNHDDPDYENHKNYESQMGPPSELIGPMGKPFGDFKMRLIYDNLLISLYFLYWTDDEEYIKKAKPVFFDQIKLHENYAKLPEFGMDKLNEIINILK